MKRIDFRQELELMRRIESTERRGESNYSSYDGDDDYYGEDSYYGEEDYDGMVEDYDGYASKGRRPSGGRGQGVINTPQRTIKFSLTNKTGIAPAHAATDINVSLFGANVNTLPGIPALGLLKNNPTFNAIVDGVSFIGDTANPTFVDLRVSGNPASYSQITAESKNSPYMVYGNKLFCSAQTQLIQDYQTQEVDLLGRSYTTPYTPSDKLSAFQFQSAIIEDPEFKLKLDGNQSINYLMFAPGNSGVPAGVENTVTFALYLYKIADISRVVSGKNPVMKSRSKAMPNSVQRFKLIK